MNEISPERNIFLKFRVCTGIPADIESMALLTERASANRAGKDVPQTVLEGSEDLRDLQERSKYDGYWSFLAFDNERLAGFVAGYPGTWRGEDDGANSEYLWLLMVDPDYQGQGIGRELLRIAADSARQKNKSSMVLYVVSDNEPAMRLYESEGYHQVGTGMSDRHGELAKYQLDLANF